MKQIILNFLSKPDRVFYAFNYFIVGLLIAICLLVWDFDVAAVVIPVGLALGITNFVTYRKIAAIRKSNEDKSN